MYMKSHYRFSFPLHAWPFQVGIIWNKINNMYPMFEPKIEEVALSKTDINIHLQIAMLMIIFENNTEH